MWTYIAFLAQHSLQIENNLQYALSDHWPCYCTVHVLLSFFFVMWFLSGCEFVQVFYRLFIYCHWRSSYHEGRSSYHEGGSSYHEGDPVIMRGWDPIIRFNPATGFVSVPLQDLEFQRYMSWYLLVFIEWRWEVIVSFDDIGGIVDNHMLNFLFIILILKYKITKF